MSYTITITNNDTSERIDVILNDYEILALKNDLWGDSGIIDWIKNAIIGKTHKCMMRMRKQWQPVLLNEEMLPPKDNAQFVSLITARKDYKNRETREAELEAEKSKK